MAAAVQYPEQFEEVFREGTATLLAELANLRTIVGRFSDFAKMPAPQLQAVDVDEEFVAQFGPAKRRFRPPEVRRSR